MKERYEKRIPLTSEILGKITKIDELKGLWRGGLNINPHILNRLKKSVIITSTGASTRIEGANMTDQVVERFLNALKSNPPENRDEDEHQQSLHGGDGGAAERAADHDVQAVYGRDERLFKETELTVPDDLDAGKDGGEDDAHANDARREELEIISFPCFREHRSEPITEREQKEQWLAERAHDARLRAQIALDLAKP